MFLFFVCLGGRVLPRVSHVCIQRMKATKRQMNQDLGFRLARLAYVRLRAHVPKGWGNRGVHPKS